MFKIFISIILLSFLNFNLVKCQSIKHWADDLRNALTLDRPILSDSVIFFNPMNGFKEMKSIYINKVRPDYKRSYELIDSIRIKNIDKKDLGRLITICLEYETRYKAEFQFNNDYYLDIYHAVIDRIPFVHKELNLLYELENTIIFFKYKNINPDTLINILIGTNSELYNKNMYITSLWKQYGGLTNLPFIDILELRYAEIHKNIEDRIKSLDLSREVDSRKFFILFKLIKNQDEICKIINSIELKNANNGMLTYFENVVWPKNKFECVANAIHKLQNLDNK